MFRRKQLLKILLLITSPLWPTAATGQQILLEDGTTLPAAFCRQDTAYAIAGTPGGGMFTGCGVYEEGGRWFFNPVTASRDEQVYPLHCTLTYEAAGQTYLHPLLVWKPVEIYPALQDTANCSGSFLLQAYMRYGGAYDYSWSPPAPLSHPDTSITSCSVQATTLFTLTVTDRLSGCTGHDHITVTKYPNPEITTGNDTMISARQPVPLQAHGGISYIWEPAAWLDDPFRPDPLADPQQDITYTVTGTDRNGCSGKDSIRIRIARNFLIPDAFSPNGDGLNDQFRIRNFGFRELLDFMVYDRWGNAVFSTTDGNAGWDGTFGGVPAPVGNYFYYIRLRTDSGSDYEVLRGSLMLIR